MKDINKITDTALSLAFNVMMFGLIGSIFVLCFKGVYAIIFGACICIVVLIAYYYITRWHKKQMRDILNENHIQTKSS